VEVPEVEAFFNKLEFCPFPLGISSPRLPSSLEAQSNEKLQPFAEVRERCEQQTPADDSLCHFTRPVTAAI